jgi:hypothetical protein
MERNAAVLDGAVGEDLARERLAPQSKIARGRRAVRRHPIRVAFTCCLLVLGGLWIRSPQWVAHQISLSFVPQAVDYSELYFTKVTQLPTHMQPGVANPVSFTIVNREGSSVTYAYTVDLSGPAGKEKVARTITVPDDHSSAVSVAIEPKLSHASYALTVTLTDPTLRDLHDEIEAHGRTT